MESGIRDAVWELGVSKTTVWRWIRRLADEGGRTSALVSRKRGRPIGTVMGPSDVEAIIDDHLTQYYLRRECPSLARVVTEMRSACRERGFQPPTRRTVQRRLDAMDTREVMKAREGAKAARQRFAAVTGRNRSERPLDVVQIDHTLDLHTVTEELAHGRLILLHAPRLPILRHWFLVSPNKRHQTTASAEIARNVVALNGSYLPALPPDVG